mmetsp:Transcript_26411/g.67894  ORF Transcript_26411/g.67894 Transcript_26411/m.67894 type:complete len:89 (-) Transcript_26411:179-445(-)
MRGPAPTPPYTGSIRSHFISFQSNTPPNGVLAAAGSDRRSIDLVPVAATQGAALCFFHGRHPQSHLHEGSLITSGTKYIIRTDVLYML